MAAETIYGTTTGYIFEEDGVRVRYIPEGSLTANEKAFIDEHYVAGGPLETQLNGLSNPLTGRDAVAHYRQYAIWYNPAAPRRVARQEVPEVGETYDQVEVNEVVNAVNGIRQLV